MKDYKQSDLKETIIPDVNINHSKNEVILYNIYVSLVLYNIKYIIFLTFLV